MIPRRISLLSVVMFLMFLVVGCSSNGATEPGAVAITFEGLRLGDQVSIGAIDATLRFANVLSDSRCPAHGPTGSSALRSIVLTFWRHRWLRPGPEGLAKVGEACRSATRR